MVADSLWRRPANSRLPIVAAKRYPDTQSHVAHSRRRGRWSLFLSVASLLFFGPVAILHASGFRFLPRTDYPTGGSCWAVALGDFNGDGRLDLAGVNFNTGTVAIYTGNGDGTFAPDGIISVGTSGGF